MIEKDERLALNEELENVLQNQNAYFKVIVA